MTKRILLVSFCEEGGGYYRLCHGMMKYISSVDWDFFNLLPVNRKVFEPELKEYYSNRLNDSGLLEAVCNNKYDAILVASDYWSVLHIGSVLRTIKAKRRSNTLLLNYCAIDSYVVDKDVFSLLELYDYIIPYTNFGKEILTINGLGHNLLSPMPHGIAMEICRDYMHKKNGNLRFRERDSKTRWLISKMPDNPEVAGLKEHIFYDTVGIPVCILYSCKNVLRKRVDLALQAFKELIDLYEDTDMCSRLFLVLDTDWSPSAKIGLDVESYIKKIGLDRSWVIDPSKLVSPEKRNLVKYKEVVFNLCKIGISTSMGEGFGQTPFYHALTGAPQVMPRHSALQELWEHCAQFVPATEAKYICPRKSQNRKLSPSFEGRVVDPLEVAAGVKNLLDNEAVFRALSYICYGRAKQFAWESVSSQWDDMFRDIL